MPIDWLDFSRGIKDTNNFFATETPNFKSLNTLAFFHNGVIYGNKSDTQSTYTDPNYAANQPAHVAEGLGFKPIFMAETGKLFKQVTASSINYTEITGTGAVLGTALKPFVRVNGVLYYGTTSLFLIIDEVANTYTTTAATDSYKIHSSHLSRMVRGNKIGAGVNDPRTISWSVPGSPTNFTDPGSGSAILNSVFDEIVDIQTIKNYLVILHTRGIILGVPTGNTVTPFEWKDFQTNINGPITHKAVVEYKDIIYFSNRRSIFTFDLNTIEEIGNDLQLSESLTGIIAAGLFHYVSEYVFFGFGEAFYMYNLLNKTWSRYVMFASDTIKLTFSLRSDDVYQGNYQEINVFTTTQRVKLLKTPNADKRRSTTLGLNWIPSMKTEVLNYFIKNFIFVGYCPEQLDIFVNVWPQFADEATVFNTLTTSTGTKVTQGDTVPFIKKLPIFVTGDVFELRLGITPVSNGAYVPEIHAIGIEYEPLGETRNT